MGFFNLFSNRPRRFVLEADFRKNMAKQMAMTPMTLQQLRKIGVTPDRELKLEYFFYTDSSQKAALLADNLKLRGYEVEQGPSASDKTTQIITGWTVKMTMEDRVVLDWTRDMCELGFSHDCDFDGWGTTPAQ
jgi:hypothetical protein